MRSKKGHAPYCFQDGVAALLCGFDGGLEGRVLSAMQAVLIWVGARFQVVPEIPVLMGSTPFSLIKAYVASVYPLSYLLSPGLSLHK